MNANLQRNLQYNYNLVCFRFISFGFILIVFIFFVLV